MKLNYKKRLFLSQAAMFLERAIKEQWTELDYTISGWDYNDALFLEGLAKAILTEQVLNEDYIFDGDNYPK